MSDFKEKYKAAIDDPEISCDFKERVFASMKELRDSPENSRKRANIKAMRTISSIAAAAACLAVVFAIGHNVGLHDSSEITSGLDNIKEEVINRSIPETTPETAEATLAVTAEAVEETAYHEEQTSAATEADDDFEISLAFCAATSDTGNEETECDESYYEEPVENAPGTEALYESPYDTGNEAEYDECYNDEVLDDTTETAFSAASSRSIYGYYSENYTEAEMTVSGKIYSAENSFLDELFSEINLLTDSREPFEITRITEDAEYSLKLADEQGNVLLIGTGNNFICFKANYNGVTVSYLYTLTDAECNSLTEIFGRYAN